MRRAGLCAGATWRSICSTTGVGVDPARTEKSYALSAALQSVLGGWSCHLGGEWPGTQRKEKAPTWAFTSPLSACP